MGLKVYPPRKGSPSWAKRIRGTLGGHRVYRTCGEGERASQVKIEIEEQFRRGELERRTGPTFKVAAREYAEAGGDPTFLARLMEHFGGRPLAEIDQAAVDAAALTLFPTQSNATRNRCVYTPVSAVLRYALKERAPRFRRPSGINRRRVVWLEPEQIFALVNAASRYGRLRPLVVYLAYTGSRLGEALALRWEPQAEFRVILDRAFAWVPKTKSGAPRGVHLPPIVMAELRPLKADSGSVFGYRNRWHAYEDLDRALADAGIALPPKIKAHVLRHSWATMMRGIGLSTDDLVDTGVWTDPRSAAVYAHVHSGEMAKKADQLPTPKPAEVKKAESA
jgi:integrase